MPSVLARLQGQLRRTDDSHRVTTLELLFDLVFVFAITGVAGLIEEQPDGRGLMQAAVALPLVWFGWVAYAWLGNHSKADEGLLRVAMIVAMAGMFLAAVSIPHAFDDHGDAAVVLVVSYAVVRLTQIAVFLVAAGDDRSLRGLILGMLGVIVVVVVLLGAGVAFDGTARIGWWLAAVLADQLGIYFVRSNQWRVPSATHLSERFGLIVLIALGETLVGTGAAAAQPELDGRLIAGLLAVVGITVCLWWLYFDVVALVAEKVLLAAAPDRRALLARDSYTYLHLPMIAGIVLAAAGMALLVRGEEAEVTAGHWLLDTGIATYLAAHAGFRLRNLGTVNVGRLVALALVLAGALVLSGLGPLAQLWWPTLVVAVLVGYEMRSKRGWRTAVRHPEGNA